MEGVDNWGDGEKGPVHTLSNITSEASSNTSRPTPKKMTLSSGSGSYRGVHCSGALLRHVEWEEEKTSSDP